MNALFSKYDKLNEFSNGIHVVITFKPTTFSYGDIWEQLPNIISCYYSAIGVDTQELKTTSIIPTNRQLENTFIAGYSFMVFSIAPNKSGNKYHCHIYLYGAHNHQGTWNHWKSKFDRGIRALSCVSSSGTPVFIEPVKDQVDRKIRDNTSNEYYQPLIEYIKTREHPSLMNYFDQRNNKNFIYHYLI